MRDTHLWLIVMYARRTEALCFASATASAVSIADVRARAKSQDVGLTRSSVTVLWDWKLIVISRAGSSPADDAIC